MANGQGGEGKKESTDDFGLGDDFGFDDDVPKVAEKKKAPKVAKVVEKDDNHVDFDDLDLGMDDLDNFDLGDEPTKTQKV